MQASRRHFLAGAAAAGCVVAVDAAFGAEPAARASARLTTLTLAGPPASVSNPLVRMVESGALAALADEVRFVGWRDPDQLRMMALEGNADVLAMPVNVAANLYNRGAKLRLLNVSVWGILWIISRDPDVHTLKDLLGKEIAMPFRGDMPDILFSLLAEREGIDPRTDFQLRYVASPIDAMQLLLMRRVDHALLAEPAVSMALRKSGSFPISLIAPELYRAIDLQAEWAHAFGGDARIPQAGIAVLGALRDQPDAVARIAEAYIQATGWCETNATACGEIVAKHIPMLAPEAITDSIGHGHMKVIDARSARPELEHLFGLLLQKSPGLVGGRLPPDDFYASPAVGAGG